MSEKSNPQAVTPAAGATPTASAEKAALGATLLVGMTTGMMLLSAHQQQGLSSNHQSSVRLIAELTKSGSSWTIVRVVEPGLETVA